MATINWKDDQNLKEALHRYVAQNVPRRDMLNYMVRDFSSYSWSIRTIDRRLRHFGIYYSDSNIPVEAVQAAVEQELDGPGQLLGYRAMHQKLRQKYNLNVPRTLVYNAMYHVAPEQLENRRPGNKKTKKEKGNFITKGVNWVWSMDGHDKLMGFQNSTFPIAIYGCIDTASRKLLWLKVWDSNSKPELVGRWYLEYLLASHIVPSYIRIDKGTETGVMATMQSYLRRNDNELDDPTDSVLYGPSTTNKIERWWKELHERLEKYYKHGLHWLLDEKHYDPHNLIDRNLMKFVMIPIIQRELDDFREIIWNTHRIRKQNDTFMVDGVPNHIYNFPKEYGLQNCGIPVSEKELQDVAELSNVLNETEDDYLENSFRTSCASIVKDPKNTACNQYVETYLTLKNGFKQLK